MGKRRSTKAIEKLSTPRVLTMRKTSLSTTKTPSAIESTPKTTDTPTVHKFKKSVRTRESSSQGSGAGRASRASEKAVSLPNLQGRSSKKVKAKKSNDAVVFPVQAIRGIQIGSGDRCQFLVKWEGYDEIHNTWEPQKNVRPCKLYILKFLEDVNKHVITFPE